MKTRYIVIAIIMYIMATIMLFKGIDKMTNYSTYGRGTNAYVGGDAYNYIINGNYATGFYVLSVGFAILGTMMIGIGMLSKFIEKYNNNAYKYNEIGGQNI